MTEAIKALLSSKKFLVAVFTVFANLALKFGLELDVDQAVALTSPLIAAIFGQTVVDVKKAGGLTQAAPTLVFAFITAGMVGLAVTSSGCDAAKATGLRAATSYVDCMQPAAIKLALELKPTFRDLLENATQNDGKIDWAPVRAAASSLTTPATRCAFSTVVSEAMRLVARTADAVQSSPLDIDQADLRTGWESIRADFYDGERFKLESGTL